MFCIRSHILCFLMSLTHQHQSLDILMSGCSTSNTITLHLNGSQWELGDGTRFSIRWCWYRMEHICWLNGFKSPMVQRMKWTSNHCAAAKYAVDTTSFSWILGETKSCSICSSMMVWGSFDTLDPWWFKTI